MKLGLATLLVGMMTLSACSKEQPVRTVDEMIENPILLEAAMVRCSQDRSNKRYEAECVNAREAVKIMAAKEERAKRAELEALSEEKRRAFRRTQDAAAEARRRAEDEQRRREEQEYLAQFGELPDGTVPDDSYFEQDVPIAEGSGETVMIDPETGETVEPLPLVPESDDDSTPEGMSEIGSVREELRKRQAEDSPE